MWKRIPLCVLAVLLSCTRAPQTRGAVTASPLERDQTPATPACELGSRDDSLPIASHATLLTKLGSGLDAYRTTGGVWLEDQPLLLNEAFDFAVALGVASIGPGIAAGKRLQANRERAQVLATLRLPSTLLDRLDGLRACGVHAYAVVWGPSGDELLLSVDRFQHDASGIPRRVAHSEAVLAIAPLMTHPEPDRASTVGKAFAHALDAALDTVREAPTGPEHTD